WVVDSAPESRCWISSRNLPFSRVAQPLQKTRCRCRESPFAGRQAVAFRNATRLLTHDVIDVVCDSDYTDNIMKISSAESQIMEALWSSGALTPDALVDAVGPANGWARNTVRV